MTDYDVVVIGSGAGGLAAAVALAQAGQKVLVLEQHYLPGGWCHTFPLGGYKFSPGVHYLGELGEGGRFRRVYEGLGVADDLVFCELNPDGYDHVLLGDERFDLPKGKQAMIDRLSARFPEQRRGIEGYFASVEGMARELDQLSEVRSAVDFLKLPWRLPNMARWGLRSLETLLAHHVTDPKLRAVLAAQAGDHGLPPSMAPAAVHAAVSAHYFEGGYYPRGGGGAIPRAFLKALRRAGGDIKVRAEVSRILVERGKVLGVRLADGQEIRSKHVISNADPHVTFGRLIDEEHLSTKLKLQLRHAKYSVSALSLFFATDLDLRAAGLDSGNYWIYPEGSVEHAYKSGMSEHGGWGKDGRGRPGMFLTCTTLKDPSKKQGPGGKHHTCEAFTFVGYDAFKAWADTKYGSRPESYAELKRELTARMIEGIGRVVPGLRDRIVFAELGTPLTNVHYVAATRGNLYGTEKSALQIGPFGFQVKTEIEGLRMCGASTLSHGVMGATLSGLVAAKTILRCRVEDLLRSHPGKIRIVPSDDLSAWPAHLRDPRKERADAAALPA